MHSRYEYSQFGHIVTVVHMKNNLPYGRETYIMSLNDWPGEEKTWNCEISYRKYVSNFSEKSIASTAMAKVLF